MDFQSTVFLKKSYFSYYYFEDTSTFIDSIAKNDLNEFKKNTDNINNFIEDSRFRIINEIVKHDRVNFMEFMFNLDIYKDKPPISHYLIELIIKHESVNILNFLEVNYFPALKNKIFLFLYKDTPNNNLARNTFEKWLKLNKKEDIIENLSSNIAYLDKIRSHHLKALHDNNINFNDFDYKILYEYYLNHENHRLIDKASQLQNNIPFLLTENESKQNFAHYYFLNDFSKVYTNKSDLFLNKSAIVSLLRYDLCGQTPLHYLVHNVQEKNKQTIFEMFNLFKQNNLDINIRDIYNRSLYLILNQKFNSAYNLYCIHLGGDPLSADDSGKKPLDFLLQIEQEFTMEIFKQMFDINHIKNPPSKNKTRL